MDSSQNSHLHALIEAALAGCLAPHEYDQLEKALEDSAQFREEYVRAVEIHLDLHHLSRQIPAPGSAAPLAPVVTRRRSRWRRLTTAALVCCLAISPFVILRNRSDHPAEKNLPASASVVPHDHAASVEPVAGPFVLEGAHARLFGQWHSPVSGDRFRMREVYTLTEGMLSLKFDAGATAVLQAPCVFSIQDVARLEIRSGKCSVHAPPGAEGFEVVSPSAEVVDLGTRFVVNVTDTGGTELLVVEGKATLASPRNSAELPLELTKGVAARVEPGMSPAFALRSGQQLTYQSALPDRVIRYHATRIDEQYVDELTSVVVQRDGQALEYERSDLIRSRITHFVSTANASTFCTRMGEELPEGEQRLALLDEDWSLVTGIINPRMLADETRFDDPVLSVEFSEPIENGPGPEILLFDLQLLVYPASGDRLRIRSGDMDRSSRPDLIIDQFDIDMTSPFAFDLLPHRTYRAGPATTCLDDLLWNEFRHGHQVHVNAKAIVVGIDLSDLGYGPGEKLRHLDLMETSDSHTIDPVLIVGLPRISKPAKSDTH